MSAVVGTGQYGSTLLEVVLAIAVLASAGLGLAATQLWLASHTQSAAIRERAAFVADAVAEAAHEAGLGTGAGDFWKAQASSVAPDGAISVAATGGGISTATIVWSRPRVTSTMRCPDAPASAARECVSLTFAR